MSLHGIDDDKSGSEIIARGIIQLIYNISHMVANTVSVTISLVENVVIPLGTPISVLGQDFHFWTVLLLLS